VEGVKFLGKTRWAVMDEHSKKRFISLIITGLALVMLVLAGPANAFTLTTTDVSDKTPRQGEVVMFDANVQLESEEAPTELSLSFNDGTTCTFSPDGTELSGCNGITVTLSENNTVTPGYGYGTGTTGSMTYAITINTTRFNMGRVKFDFQANVDGNEVSSTENAFTVTGPAYKDATTSPPYGKAKGKNK
jgi:hypothetical protein